MGWYRRALRLDTADRGKRIELQIGAIATHATVWVNGSIVAHNWSGYNSLDIDLTPFARYGDELNIIAIRADATPMEGWWYEGAGLYRHVWLARRAPVSIITDGIHCDPRKGADGTWRVPVTATLTNIEKSPVPVTLEATLLDPDGREIATGRVGLTVPVLAEGTAALVLDPGAQPRLWSVESPTLYAVRTRVLRDGKAVDELIDGLEQAQNQGRWQPSVDSESRRLALLPETLPQAWDELMYQPAYLQALDLLP